MRKITEITGALLLAALIGGCAVNKVESLTVLRTFVTTNSPVPYYDSAATRTTTNYVIGYKGKELGTLVKP